MKRHVFDKATDNLLRVEEDTPKCGDFCDRCGECLGCDSDSDCVNGHTQHFWVVYEDAPTESAEKG